MDGPNPFTGRGMNREPTGMTDAPQVLVVARYRNAEETLRIGDCLSRQTYSNVRLVIIQDREKDAGGTSSNLPEICSESEFNSYLEKSGAGRVLFWPDEGNLREAAIEKLVLALQSAPDQNGVADAAKGGTGLWLARTGPDMNSLISLWLKSKGRWIEECQRRKASLFHIPENLMEGPDDAALRHPHAVGHLFGKLPFNLKSFETISTEPLWPIAEMSPDDNSVLFLITCLPIGGACKFILDIAGQLKAQGYRVTVATTIFSSQNPNPWLDELLRIVPDVFVLSHSRPVELPRLIVHLARTRRCGRIVLSHSMVAYQLLPWLRLELPDVAFLDYTHIEYETEWPDGGYALRSVNNQSLLDLSMVSSHHLREWMIDRGADAGAVRVCHTNIDTEKWAPSPDIRARVRYELGVDSKTALILYPCRLAAQKRPELLCNIVATLRRATKAPFVVAVAGDGPLMAPLKKFVEKERLEHHVRLFGAVSLERVAQLHNAADIFLLPSLIEGIALALFEAMALESVPVVADVGGQRELVTPDCGDLIPTGNITRELTDYVSALKLLLENPGQRRQMATACRSRVTDHFRIGQMTVNFISALEEAGLRHAARPAQLPSPAACREVATLAIDHIRSYIEGSIGMEAIKLLKEEMDKQEKIIQRLQRQIVTLRSTQPLREENELPC